MNSIKDIEKMLGIKIHNEDIFNTALTHRSFLNENRNIKEHNERLEFLGDAVLELITSEYLYSQFPDRAEGELTSFRSALVKTDSLAAVSKDLQLGKYLKLSRGEEETGGRQKDYLLANTFESVLGAIYLDSGYSASKEFVLRVLIPRIDDIVKDRLDIDSKTKIQELAQSKFRVTPIYEVIDEKGPDHNKIFTVVVKLESKVIGKGVGASKQKAEEDAATNGLEYMEKE